jgi:hypothetical protein
MTGRKIAQQPVHWLKIAEIGDSFFKQMKLKKQKISECENTR